MVEDQRVDTIAKKLQLRQQMRKKQRTQWKMGMKLYLLDINQDNGKFS